MIDGDTLDVRTSRGVERLRIGQVDAPERSQSFGPEATACLSRAVIGATLRMCRDGSDQYGRTIANLSASGADVGQSLVAQGCAWAYYKYLEAGSPLPDLELRARLAKLGLWATDAVAPWTYRSGGSPVTVDRATGRPAVAVSESNQASTHDRVFDWAEHEFADLLVGGSRNQTLADGTIYRCYATGFCVGYRSGVFLTYDGISIKEVGSAAQMISMAQAKGF